MNQGTKDKELGMCRQITRRDFLNGVAIGVGATLVAGEISSEILLAAGALDESHRENPQTTRHPQKWACAETTMRLSPLPIVCATAYFYCKSAGNRARILILDNYDDFGGHAKRNEFRTGGRTALSEKSRVSNPCRRRV
jgi:spermidine dehydrogenase